MLLESSPVWDFYLEFPTQSYLQIQLTFRSPFFDPVARASVGYNPTVVLAKDCVPSNQELILPNFVLLDF